MRRAVVAVCVASVIWVAAASEANAERPRFFPTLGAGVNVAPNDDAHGFLWLGLSVRPKDKLFVPYWQAALEVDFHGDVATFAGTFRLGTAAFMDRRAWVPGIAMYGIAGGGRQKIGDEVYTVLRLGAGLSIPPLILLAEAGLACPTTIELVADISDGKGQATLRVGWGF
jgi:hypothetical protein